MFFKPLSTLLKFITLEPLDTDGMDKADGIDDEDGMDKGSDDDKVDGLDDLASWLSSFPLGLV